MNLQTSIAVPPHVVSRKVAEELVILNVQSGKYFGLDPVGARVWECLVSGQTIGQALAVMQAEFEVDAETLSRDIYRLVQDLSACGLVISKA